MAFFRNTFYDKYGNFDNSKFVNMLEKSKKQRNNKSSKSFGNFNSEIVLFNSVSKKELWEFINKFSIFVNSGIDIKWSLNILTKQTKNPYFRKIVNEIKQNINYGIAINETMINYPKVFDNLIVALIGVGEKTGQLGKILSELDKSLLESIELKSRVKSAMVYPIILFGLTLSMVTFMMSFVVPRITESFEKTGTDLPWLTQKIINISNFIVHDWGKLIAIIIVIIFIFRAINSTYKGKMFFAKLYIKLPIFGIIVKESNVVYFIRSFTILLDSGVLLLESMKTSSQVVPNLAYKKELIRIKNEVEVGLTISKSLGLNLEYEKSIYINKLFPEDFAYIVSTGEETGTLSESMKKVGVNYSTELKRYIGNLASIMEPMVIILVGGIVGTIVVGIMLPFFELGEIAKKL